MVTRRKETLSFTAALALHAAALLALRVAIGERFVPSRTPIKPASGFETELGVSIDLDTSAAASSTLGGEFGEVREARNARNDARARASALDGTEPNPDGAPVSAETELGIPSETETETETDDAQTHPIDLGIGPNGWQRWVASHATERQPAKSGPRSNRFHVYDAPPVSTTGGLQEGLEESDRALGLGPQGRVLSATHQAAHEWVAPQLGVARFDVTVRRDGVVEVTLGDASGEVEAWKKVAKHIADDLRASPPTIKPPRTGVRLVVEIVAEETLPNGTKIKSLTSPHLEVTPPKLQSTERSVEDVADDNPTATDPHPSLPPIKLDLPGIYLAERGKVCSYRLGLSALGPVFQGGCDPSHIGAKPQRVVRARVIEQNMF